MEKLIEQARTMVTEAGGWHAALRQATALVEKLSKENPEASQRDAARAILAAIYADRLANPPAQSQADKFRAQRLAA